MPEERREGEKGRPEATGEFSEYLPSCDEPKDMLLLQRLLPRKASPGPKARKAAWKKGGF
jgi:hypothetical protein